MADWRRRAAETFPHLAAQLEDENHIHSVYELFFRLTQLWRACSKNQSQENLALCARIADYCKWANDCDDNTVKNAVGVSFLEHLGVSDASLMLAERLLGGPLYALAIRLGSEMSQHDGATIRRLKASADRFNKKHGIRIKI